MDLRHFHDLWSAGNTSQAGQLIYEFIPICKRPAWAADILDLCRQVWPKIIQVDAVWEIARNSERWSEAHAAFSAVRSLTLVEDRTHEHGNIYLLLLVIAEFSAKVIFNASGSRCPFDDECGQWLVQGLRDMADQVSAVDFRWAALRLLSQWALNAHCSFQHPFCRVIVDPSWLDWSSGTVRKLAQVIYEQRTFDRLPILADALEDAGCSDADILTHCRQPGEHVRGCWALDLILGKS
ncbi:MAG: hypothetical protein K2R98_05020 [Gemmataceae bacterium]|nr:hypothetical protein [Gemmataceae bacterium]